ncbi:alpha-ketoglutarate-dependent dioxygenase AlkB family protein [Paraferrimonas haliotis]|uniref:2OG-Fe(II) oxygenase n=1 Tax=Paraferrimonas haliotis TaxID=2013866 RepID=A0AA37TQH2_9GAMM|nr:alpha-ketoglutarate-dependent dioxygenase AlkB [Paraferrimonas haliotis]GLS82771.1 2OG-Fe(II) oxygenase [Paraferrimonas haliotis]
MTKQQHFIFADGAVSIVRNWLSLETLQRLQAEAVDYPWQQPSIQLFGKSHRIPRQQVWFAHNNAGYRYSGKIFYGEDYPECLLDVQSRLNRVFKLKFNSVLANHYRTGMDSMGWHSDDEPELIASHPIGSLTIGASRDFCLRNKHTRETVKFELQSGDLVIMWPPMQAHWQHAVPKRSKVSDARLNFTFRAINDSFHR